MLTCQNKLLNNAYCTPTFEENIFNIVFYCAQRNEIFVCSRNINDETFEIPNICKMCKYF